MNQDSLKLTTYFGERDRTEDHLLADELLGLYGRHQVQCGVLLRGISGFGAKHQLRTDRILTLSEDLPVVSVAVDSRERIDSLLGELLQIKRRGLLTLERARMLTNEIQTADITTPAGDATKLTVYVGRQERAHRSPAFVAVCDLLHRRGLSGATVLLGVDGTLHGTRSRARFFGRNASVPMMIISVGPSEQIADALPALGELLENPLLTLESVRICKRDGELVLRPHELPATDEHGLAIWQKLMVHTSEATLVDGHPLHRLLVQRLRAANLAGATSVRGIWGFHGDHAPHGDKFLQARRHVPVVTIIVDAPQRIEQAFDIVDELTRERGLVTSEMVPAVTTMTDQSRTGGTRLARPPL